MSLPQESLTDLCLANCLLCALTMRNSSSIARLSYCIVIFDLYIPKPLTVWITINCGKFWKRWEHQTTWPPSWETCTQVRKQQLELDVKPRCVYVWDLYSFIKWNLMENIFGNFIYSFNDNSWIFSQAMKISSVTSCLMDI